MQKVPLETSVVNNEPKAEKYILPFAPELIPFIEDGNKVRTYRFGRKYDYLQPGDTVAITCYTDGRMVGMAKIISKDRVTFSDLPLETEGHESYADKEHQRKIFSGYYAYLERPIVDTDEFLVFEFRLIAS